MGLKVQSAFYLKENAPMFHVKHYRGITILIVIALFASGCTVSRSPITGKKRAYAYTWEQELQIGAQADQQIQAAYGLYPDEELTRYVQQVGQEVLAKSHFARPDTPSEFRQTPFHFRVLDSPVVNAFALPGGYIYVTRGLLAHMNNEAQLAVVLGHEIGHVAARHASQRAFEQQLGQIVLLGGAIAGQELLNLPAQEILNLGGAAAQLMFLKYSRSDEEESDKLGVEYAAMANYEAAEGSAFFESLERIGEKSGQSIPTWMSSHPDPGDREERIIALAQRYEQQFPMDRIEQNDLYDAIDGMIIGENPRNGFVENGVFYHPEMRFQFPVPRNFQVANQASQVVMVDQEQRAVNVFTIARQSSAQAAGREFAGQQGLQVVNSGATTSNGLPAFYVLADVQTEQGQVIRILAYYVEFSNNVFGFTAYSLREQFSTFEQEFMRSMKGFDRLTDQAILNVQPVRLDIQSAQRSASFENFVPSTLPRDLDGQELAIMNQVGLNTSVPAGALLKLPSR